MKWLQRLQEFKRVQLHKAWYERGVGVIGYALLLAFAVVLTAVMLDFELTKNMLAVFKEDAAPHKGVAIVSDPGYKGKDSGSSSSSSSTSGAGEQSGGTSGSESSGQGGTSSGGSTSGGEQGGSTDSGNTGEQGSGTTDSGNTGGTDTGNTEGGNTGGQGSGNDNTEITTPEVTTGTLDVKKTGFDYGLLNYNEYEYRENWWDWGYKKDYRWEKSDTKKGIVSDYIKLEKNTTYTITVSADIYSTYTLTALLFESSKEPNVDKYEVGTNVPLDNSVLSSSNKTITFTTSSTTDSYLFFNVEIKDSNNKTMANYYDRKTQTTYKEYFESLWNSGNVTITYTTTTTTSN